VNKTLLSLSAIFLFGPFFPLPIQIQEKGNQIEIYPIKSSEGSQAPEAVSSKVWKEKKQEINSLPLKSFNSKLDSPVPTTKGRSHFFKIQTEEAAFYITLTRTDSDTVHTKFTTIYPQGDELSTEATIDEFTQGDTLLLSSPLKLTGENWHGKTLAIHTK